MRPSGRSPAGNRRRTSSRPRLRLAGLRPVVMRLAAGSCRAALRLRRPALALAAIGFAIASIAGMRSYLLRSTHFALRNLVLPPSPHESSDSLRARLHIERGTNLFRIDLPRAVRELEADPWVASAQARRELPSTLVFDIVWHEPRAAVVLGGLYLVDAEGVPFKRAEGPEADGLPIVTGISREAYDRRPAAAQTAMRQALDARDAFGADGARPAIGEVHVDLADGDIALVTLDGATEVRLGRREDLPGALARFDAIWTAIGADRPRVRLIDLDDATRPDRVTVRLLESSTSLTVAAGRAPGSAAN